jgi:hypothetical protein
MYIIGIEFGMPDMWLFNTLEIGLPKVKVFPVHPIHLIPLSFFHSQWNMLFAPFLVGALILLKKAISAHKKWLLIGSGSGLLVGLTFITLVHLHGTNTIGKEATVFVSCLFAFVLGEIVGVVFCAGGDTEEGLCIVLSYYTGFGICFGFGMALLLPLFFGVLFFFSYLFLLFVETFVEFFQTRRVS